MLAAAVVLLGSVAAAVVAVVAVLLVLPREVAEGRAHPAHKLLPLVLLQVAAVLARVPPEAVLLHLLSLLLPQVVVESEGTAAPQGPPVVLSRNGKEFTANGATNVRAGPSTRSPPNGRPWPSACLNWMPARG